MKKLEVAKPKAQQCVYVNRKSEKVEQPKPGESNASKPAPHGYKARYNLLLEKYNKSVETQKEQKQHINTLEQQVHDARIFQEQHIDCDSIKQKFKKLHADVSALEKELNVKRREGNKLTTEVCELKLKKEQLTFKHNQEKSLSERLANALHASRSELTEQYELRRKLHNALQDLKGNIRVYCRVRPVSQNETDRAICSFTFMDETTFEIKKNNDTKAEFTFDKVFAPFASQMEVFEDLAELIQSALDGYNICVFAYGQTGAGKTFTMQEKDTSSSMGMIPRSIELIFSKIAKLRSTGWKYKVSASFLEIYNENIKDLLNPSSQEKYEICYNEGKGTTVRNLIIHSVTSADELTEIMCKAQSNRVVECTNFNEHSSRSHFVTKIILNGKHQDSDAEHVGSLCLVDLAGSESAKTSVRLNETKNINKSLSALGSVLLALYNKDTYVPYRNSKLTYLLQSSLGGNSKILMFVNISPFQDCFMESISSLRFASKVKEVRSSSKKNKVYKMDTSSYKFK